MRMVEKVDLLPFANPEDEEWRGTKAQREALRQKFGGKCAYCGGDLGKAMHADHMEPVIRVRPSQWNDLDTVKLLKPERNTVGNMMPACAPCNLHKGGYKLEQWRTYLQRSAEIVRRQTSTFRAGERFGIINVREEPIVFHFERVAALDGEG
ncbi:HNH endonuclease [Sphingobium sp. HDIP04]|uniref:HNH endonuclease n=1 Tax=Sphingobium sp. HDIP04 TaxID=428994 RepID=UPI00038780A8|nr:HNH endonuclease [Sphingobium sp. HDIP04]EQB03846.1 HNH endonuclease [Sphingobium sp. HDIP04]